MSHVSQYETEAGKPFITCLLSIATAAERLGLKVEEKADYRWFGKHVGDWPLPEGWTASELGHNAVLVLSMSAEKKKEMGIYGDYEIGVVPDKKNPGAFTLMYDFFGQASRLDQIVGSPVLGKNKETLALAPRLVQHYRMAADEITAAQVGDKITFEELEDGSWVSVTVPNETRLLERS